MRGVAVLFVGAGILMILMAVWFGGTTSSTAQAGDLSAERSAAGPLATEYESGFLETPVDDDPGADAFAAAQEVPGALEAGGFLEVEDAELTDPIDALGDADTVWTARSGESSPPPTEAAQPGPAGLAAADRPRAGAGSLEPWEAVGAPSGSADVITREVDLAASLAHGGAEGVLDYLTRVEPDVTEARRNLVLAFAAALLGNEDRSRELGAGLEDSGEISGLEHDLLEAARIGQDVLDLRAAEEARQPMALAMRMALLERSGRVHLENTRHALAARCYSDLMLSEVSAPWSDDREALLRWTQGVEESQRGHRWAREGQWPSVSEVVQNGDSLVRIRKRVLKSHPDLLLCTGLIDRANRLTGQYIHPNDELRIPVDRPSMLVDLSARWALFLLGDEVAAAWEVGIGKDGHETQTGVFTVGEKKEEPMWFRPGQQPVPFGDPDNPLGTRWLAWHRDGVKTSLGFHGTSDPDGVGHRVSLGCIRMHNEDVEELFEILPLGALVRVQP